MHKLLLIVYTITLSWSLQAQEDYNLSDDIYLENIKSVRLHHVGLPTSAPIIDLNSGGRLLLSFDDLEGGDITYRYRIIHCDKDWNPSGLEELDYIDGFNDEQIENSSYSIGTFTNYTHYELTIPNNDIQWTLSGNYILYVYEDEYDEVPALTRRFMVVEPLVTVLGDVIDPMNVQQIRSHQELKFKVNYKNFRIANPMNEIELVLMQNHRWDTAIKSVTPRFVNGEDIMFNYVGRHNFPAGKEFRIVDLRSTRYRGEGVHSMDLNRDGVDMLLFMDESRYWANYHTYADINGNYVLESADDNNDELKSNYVNAHFSLQLKDVLTSADIYVVGQLSDWKLREECKLQYDAFRGIYTTSILLKQGFYDYQYAIDYGEEVDYSALEGDWYEAENEYTILVYYTEFGARYDRLIGLATLNSNL